MNAHPAVDSAVFAELAGHDPVRLVKLAGMFVRNAGEDVARLEAALAKGDIGAAKRIAHKLKSSSAYVGAEPLRRLAEALERGPDRPAPNELDRMAAELRLQFAATTSALQAISGGTPDAPQGPR